MPESREMWVVLVPTKFEDNGKPVSTRHHRVWDAHVRKITGGLSIYAPIKGQWVCPETNKLYLDRILPVHIACYPGQIDAIIELTIRHYRQIAVMAYKVSTDVKVVHASELKVRRK